MTSPTFKRKTWSIWHARLHKQLQANKALLPDQSSLLLAISGGQDSMALVKLILDLQRIYKWKIHIWHGDHGWHAESKKIAADLKNWCDKRKLNFYSDQATKHETNTENKAREWRYQNLLKTARLITSLNPDFPCNLILTGHTGSDRAETLLFNLSRGSNLKGLSSLKASRCIDKNIVLARPMLCFSRDETQEICRAMKLPIWLDPSNMNMNFSRNKIRQKVLPILEEIHPKCTIRIASLAERIENYEHDLNSLAKVALKAIKTEKGLSRKEISQLKETARATILLEWFNENGVNGANSIQLMEISRKISKGKPPGTISLSQGWKLAWENDSVRLTQLNSLNS